MTTPNAYIVGKFNTELECYNALWEYCEDEWDPASDGIYTMDEWFVEWDMSDFCIVPLELYPIQYSDQMFEPSRTRYYQLMRNVKLKELGL